MRLITFLPVFALTLTSLIFAFSLSSERYWSDYTGKFDEEDGIRATIGLPSIAVGASYAGTRNPILETFCSLLYDYPGGYCYSVAASFIENPLDDPEIRASLPGFGRTSEVLDYAPES